jgi:hypothetical protein
LWFFGRFSNFPSVASTSQPGTTTSTGQGTSLDIPKPGTIPHPGGRFTFGYWEIEENPWVAGGIRLAGVEATVYFVGQRSADLRADASTTLSRPFFDINNHMESGFPVSAPGVAVGNITARAQATFWGAEVNGWGNLAHDGPGTTCSLDLMGGLRFLNADFNAQIGSVSAFNSSIDPTSPFAGLAGDKLTIRDSFTTHNRFYGAQVGIAGKYFEIPTVTVEAGLKLALGVTSEDLHIAGKQLLTLPNQTTTVSNAGLLALPSNIGLFHRNKFTEIPEANIKFACAVTGHMKLSASVTALYWNKLARAGEQINREIDITQIPNFPPGAAAAPTGLGRPQALFEQTGQWLLGLSVGLEFIW